MGKGRDTAELIPTSDLPDEELDCECLEEVLDKLEDLESSHQTLAKLTKQSYQHSQQNYLSVRQTSDRVGELHEQLAPAKAWRLGMSERIDALEQSHAILLQAQAVIERRLIEVGVMLEQLLSLQSSTGAGPVQRVDL